MSRIEASGSEARVHCKRVTPLMLKSEWHEMSTQHSWQFVGAFSNAWPIVARAQISMGMRARACSDIVSAIPRQSPVEVATDTRILPVRYNLSVDDPS